MAKIAKEKKASLAVAADGLDALTALSEKVKAMGVDDLVLDSGARKAKDMIEHFTIIRRAAIKKNFKPLVTRSSPLPAATTTLRRPWPPHRDDEVRLDHHPEQRREMEDARSAVLRQNIYTDPQVPMQVAQNIYKVGDAKKARPS